MAAGVDNGEGSRIIPLDRGDEKQRFYVAGASIQTSKRENGAKGVPLQLLKHMLMIPIALQERCYERDVSSDTPNEQPGNNCPSLHPGPRWMDGQNAEEYEDQGTVPKYIFNSDIFNSDDTVRAMRSWGECRWPDSILY